MKISEARKNLKAKLDAGLISIEESSRFNRRLSEIAASNKSWTMKAKLFSIWGCE